MSSSKTTPERELDEDLSEKMLDSKMTEMQQLIEYLDKVYETMQKSSKKDDSKHGEEQKASYELIENTPPSTQDEIMLSPEGVDEKNMAVD